MDVDRIVRSGHVKRHADGSVCTYLTDRETEIMRTVLECGGSTKAAAGRLGLSRNTVRNTRSACYAKLGVWGATDFWVAMGWARVPPPRGD